MSLDTVEDVYSSLQDSFDDVGDSKFGPLPAVPENPMIPELGNVDRCQCEGSICRTPNGVKLNPFYLQNLRGEAPGTPRFGACQDCNLVGFSG